MCTGAELLLAAQIAGGAAAVVGTVATLTKKTPQATPSTVGVDAATATDKAAQEAAQKKLAQRRAARANSLLSEAGGAGDTSSLLTEGAAATGKLTTGA